MTETLRRHRRTKIIATLGPASSSVEMMGQLFQAGADVFRLNFSHGSHEDHAARITAIRSLEKKFGRPIGILADVHKVDELTHIHFIVHVLVNKLNYPSYCFPVDLNSNCIHSGH